MADEASFRGLCEFSKLDRLPDDLYWINLPQPPYELVTEGGARRGGLHVTPATPSDFWQKTFYSPVLAKADAPALLRRVPNDLHEWSAELHFSLERAGHQFDQAGLMVFADEENWLKAGIEMVDTVPRLSCVITSNGRSDWSVRPWRSAAAAVRVSHVRSSVVMETLEEDGRWSFCRISPSMVGEKREVGAGLFCCSPKETGMTAIFHSLSFCNCVTFDHHS